MGLWNWLTGSESEHGEEHDGRLVTRHDESDTYWSYGGHATDEVKAALDSDGYTIVEDNRSLWSRLFG